MAGVQCKFVVSYQITFGQVGRDTPSKAQPRFIHKRWQPFLLDRLINIFTDDMTTKSEKENRKDILRQLREKEKTEFLNSLPMVKDLFGELFDYLDERLGVFKSRGNHVAATMAVTMRVYFKSQQSTDNRVNSQPATTTNRVNSQPPKKSALT